MKYSRKYAKLLRQSKGFHNGIISVREEYLKEIRSQIIVATSLIISLIGFLCYVTICEGAVDDKQAVRAIIGEASNQGYRGMLAISGAIRNRDTLRGVYGVNSKHIDNEPKWVWEQARRAWKESETNDISNGATHWENTKQFGIPYWVQEMDLVFQYRDHWFYKQKGKD